MSSWQRTHDWGALTRAEVASARDAGALAVLTVGSCEQHADHLPVDTDTLSAYRVAMLRQSAASTRMSLSYRRHRSAFRRTIAPGLARSRCRWRRSRQS